MAVAINWQGYDPISIASEPTEDAPKQQGARVVVAATVSGAAGAEIPAGRFGLKQVRGVVNSAESAGTVVVDIGDNTVTIDDANGVYNFELFGERAGEVENFDANLLQ